MKRLIGILAICFAVSPAFASDIVEVVSPGGIKAWLRSEPSIPLVSIEFRFQGGSVLVPAEKAGTATIAASMLSEGAGEWDGDAFREALADNAIGLGFSAERDGFSGNVTTLTENRELASRMLRAALTEAHMSADAFRQQKSRLIVSRRRSLTSPNAIAYRAWLDLAFDEHPYAQSVRGSVESVAKIEQADIDDFLGKVLTRQGLTIGVAGDISPEDLGEWLDAAFGALPDHPMPSLPAAAPPLPSGLAVVPHNSPQSVIVFGQSGISRQDPDWYAALTVMQVLGGGTFSSRLGEEVREKRGLAYGISAGLSPNQLGSLILGRTATTNSSVAEVVAIIQQEWRRLAEEGPSTDELDDAKAYLTGSFPLSLDSSENIASVLVQMQLYHLGMDYWERRPDLFDAITLDDAKRVAARILQSDDLLIVAVGEPDNVKPTLAPPPAL